MHPRAFFCAPCLAIVFSTTVLVGCGGDDTESGTAAASTGGGGTDRTLVLLYTSDEHSHVFAFSPELDDFPTATKAGTGELLGGAARRATVIRHERDAATAASASSLLVSAGDNQMGALPHVAFESASADYGMMVSLGYDVTTFGNHEFDFGPAALGRSLDAAEAGSGAPPIVATNLHLSDDSPDDDGLAAHVSADPTDKAMVHPYRIVTTDNGIKVGFIGYLGVNAEFVAPNKTPVRFSAHALDASAEGDQKQVLPELYKDLQPTVDKLRNDEKVELVVALSHGGIDNTSSQEGIEQGDDWQVAKNVTGIDVIISGHAHNPDPKPIVVPHEGGRDTVVLCASSFGKHVGRIELVVHGDASKAPSWDKAKQDLLPIDDTTIPDPDLAKGLDGLVESIEKSGRSGGGTYLEDLVTRVEGAPVTNDAGKAGDLYFHEVGKTDFDITDTHSRIFLSADAMLAATDKLAIPTNLALESAGVIRNVIKKGKTGVISVADSFSVVPLGSSPADGTIGYPLVRAFISGSELRAVFEFALGRGPSSSDYDLGQAGIKVEYDKTRPPVLTTVDFLNASKGQVMRIWLDSDHSDGFEQFDQLVYDREGGIAPPDGTLFSVVTSSYIAQFADSAGVTLKDDTGATLPLEKAILHYTDGAKPEVKQIEVFLTYLKNNAPLPALYDPTSASATQRIECIAGCN